MHKHSSDENEHRDYDDKCGPRKLSSHWFKPICAIGRHARCRCSVSSRYRINLSSEFARSHNGPICATKWAYNGGEEEARPIDPRPETVHGVCQKAETEQNKCTAVENLKEHE